MKLVVCLLFGVIGLLLSAENTKAVGFPYQLAWGISNEQSDVGVGESTNYVFLDRTITVNYQSGPVCLSSVSNSCVAMQTDDAIRIYVDNQLVYSFDSYTSSYGPIDFSQFLSFGDNDVRIQLVDLLGPNRGSSEVWLVHESGGGSPNTEPLTAVLQQNGPLFSSYVNDTFVVDEGADTIFLPVRVTVQEYGQLITDSAVDVYLEYPYQRFIGTIPAGGLFLSFEEEIPVPLNNGYPLQVKVIKQSNSQAAFSNTLDIVSSTTRKQESSALSSQWAAIVHNLVRLTEGVITSIGCEFFNSPNVYLCGYKDVRDAIEKLLDYSALSGDTITFELF